MPRPKRGDRRRRGVDSAAVEVIGELSMDGGGVDLPFLQMAKRYEI